MRPGEKLLEVGVGTGRVATPLLDRRVDVVGLDLSPSMLRQFRRKSAPANPHAVCADIVALPFRSGSLGAVLGVHLFHLVTRWRDGLEEVRRVLRPGGRLLHSWHRASHGSIEIEMRQTLAAIARSHGASIERPGARDAAQVIGELAEAGVSTRTVEVASWASSTTPGEMIRLLRGGLFSYTWSMDAGLAAACLDELEAWALGRYGSLDVVERFEESFELHVHEFGEAARRDRPGARLADARTS